jgi:hypothetical protein
MGSGSISIGFISGEPGVQAVFADMRCAVFSGRPVGWSTGVERGVCGGRGILAPLVRKWGQRWRRVTGCKRGSSCGGTV